MEGNHKCCGLSLGLTLGILWAASVAIVGVGNRYCPDGYGGQFLSVLSSVYPGYHAGSGLKNLAIGVAWAFGDGFVGGFLIAWLYNLVSKKKE